MKVFLIVHGAVQGVGYRNLVKNVAVKCGIVGMVRNAADGSVQIYAEGSDSSIEEFISRIDVDYDQGPQVFNIERHYEGSPEFPEEPRSFNSFVIEKTV
jgi:acylphosphatase